MIREQLRRRAAQKRLHITQSAISQRSPAAGAAALLRAASSSADPAAAGFTGPGPEAAGPATAQVLPAGAGAGRRALPDRARGPHPASASPSVPSSPAAWTPAPPWRPAWRELGSPHRGRTCWWGWQGPHPGPGARGAGVRRRQPAAQPLAGCCVVTNSARCAIAAHRQPPPSSPAASRTAPQRRRPCAKAPAVAFGSARRACTSATWPVISLLPRWLPRHTVAILRGLRRHGGGAGHSLLSSSRNLQIRQQQLEAGHTLDLPARSPPGRAALLAPLGAGAGAAQADIIQRLIQQGDRHCKPR